MLSKYTLTNNEPINQQIYGILRHDIVTCAIKPGTPLSEKEISANFNVSRQPVREAFIKLAEAGLIQILPQRGSFVVKISAKRVSDGRFIREAIESAVIRKAALTVTPEQLTVLKYNLNRQALAAGRDQTAEFLALDDQFHSLFAQIAECPTAWQSIQNIKATMDRVRFLSLSEVSPPESLIEQHYNIFYALEARDPNAAELAMQEHLREIIVSINPIAEQNVEWFEYES
jgi:DNA-binding GntR family transcriptional regulator